jgi:hypothetical protein
LDTGPNGFGGGVANEDWSSMTIANSTISGNTAFGHRSDSFGDVDAYGGGIWNGVGRFSWSSQLVLTNCTVTGNAAVGSLSGGGVVGGGGIATGISDFTNEPPSTLTINNCTISGNTAHFVGGIANGRTLTISNSIVAGNGGGNISIFGSGSFTDLGHNLIGGNPLLGPLQDNGGPTQTMALLAGSPALNAGDPAQLGVADQRGVIRSGGVNIGAYQASASAFVLTAPATITAGAPFSITVQAVDPFGQTALGYTGTVHFTASNGAMANYPFTATDAGQHTFNGLVLRQAGTLTVTGTDATDSTVTGATSFTVTPAAADHLLFLQQPTDTAAGQTLSPVTVAVVDQYGNVETDDTSDTVTLSLDTNPSGGTLSGTLTVAVVNGIATFSDLALDLAGDGYTLHALTVGLADADSAAFRITA